MDGRGLVHEALIGRVSDATPVVLGYVDDRLVYRYLNPSGERVVDASAPEVIGRPLGEVIGRDTDAYRAIETVLRTGRAFEDIVEYASPRSPGESGYFLSAYTPDVDPGSGAVRGVVLAGIDLSDSVIRLLAAERRLGETTRLLHEIVDNSQTAIYAKDLEGRFILNNTTSARLLGLAPAELLGKRDSDIMPAQFADSIWEHDQEVMRAGIREQYEERIVVDGEERTYVSVKFPLHDDSGEVVGVAGLSTDITERIRAEEERAALARLAEMRADELDAIFEAMVDALVVFDVGGRAVRANRKAAELLGFDPTTVSREQAAARFDLRSVDGSPVDPARFPSVRAQRGEIVRDQRFRLSPAGGLELIVSASAAPMSRDDEIVGAVSIWRDITEEEQLQARMRQESEAHAEAERRLQAVLDTMPVGVFVADESGSIVATNPAADRIWGGIVADANAAGDYAAYVGRWAETGEPLGADDWGISRALRKRETSEGEVIDIERFDGGCRTILNSAAPIVDDTGRVRGAIAAILDITEYRRATDELARVRERERYLAQVLTSSSQPFAQAAVTGEMLYANPAFEALTGYTLEELQAGTWWRITPVEWHETERAVLDELHRTGQPQLYQKEYVRKDGFRVPVEILVHLLRDERGEPVSYYAFISDISERKVAEGERERVLEQLNAERQRAEQAAAESTERASQLDSVFRSIADGVVIYDSDGRIVRWNEQAARIFGYSEEYRERPILERLMAFQVTDERGRLLLASEFPSVRALAGEVVRNRVVSMAAPDRPTIWVSISAAPIERDGKRVGAVATLLDISSQRELAETQDRLAREVEEVNRELTAVAQVTDVAISTLDLPSLLKAILERLVAVMGADAAIILLVEGDRLRAFEAIGVEGESRSGFEVAIGEGFAGSIAATRRPRYLADAQENPLVKSPHLKAAGIRSMLGVPLQVGGVLIGVLHVDWLTVRPEYPRQTALLQLAADRVSLAVRNAQLYEERQRAAGFSAALNEIDAAISSTLEFSEILERVVGRAAQVVDADAAVIFLAEEGGWRAAATWNIPERLAGHWYRRDQVPYSSTAEEMPDKYSLDNDVRSNPGYERIFAGLLGATGVLDAALVVAGEPVADFGLYHLDGSKRFTEEQADFMRKMATSLTLALQNARRYADERHVADTLQRALLQIPSSIDGVRYECLYRSAARQASVGGDFYDMFGLEDGRVGVVIGDVSGKGLTASTLTSLVRNTLRAYAYDLHSPAEVLAKANRVIYQAIPEEMFVTLIFGMLDPSTGNFIYANAGHPAALVMRSEGIDALEATSPLLGAVADIEFAEARTMLRPGDVLFTYTDGVIEARAGDELYGEERLVSLAMRLRGMPAERLPGLVWEDLQRFTGGAAGDDVAMLAVSLESPGDTVGARRENAGSTGS